MSLRAPAIVLPLLFAGAGAYIGSSDLRRAVRFVNLPGDVSRSHHQIERTCESCHTPFAKVGNDACNACHAQGLALAGDTHPTAKFTDPRNADRTAHLDARACVTCHGEHAPDRTRPGGVTVPADFCAACHKDVGVERPSHRGFAFESCAQVGCHNFHDNRPLYETFLQKHLDEPDVLPSAVSPTWDPSTVARLREPSPGLTAAEADGPADADVERVVVRGWELSAHARSGVNCTGCHATREGRWQARPDRGACARCHEREEGGFLHGLHGMRLAAGLSPMTPALARLPMKAQAQTTELGCASCHRSHEFDTRRAAVEACLSCHDDRHSLAYKASRHYLLLQRERGGEAPAGTGVSCATCHLPRTGGAGPADHDQSANLRPRNKMVRGICMQCHGLGFSLDALADAELVGRNFNGRPSVHVASLELARRRLSDADAKKGDRP